MDCTWKIKWCYELGVDFLLVICTNQNNLSRKFSPVSSCKQIVEWIVIQKLLTLQLCNLPRYLEEYKTKITEKRGKAS